nr:unnamed protein product [Digitaria exilis]
MTTDGSNGEAVIGDDEVVESWATEIHDQSVDWVVPLNILPYSSHRDGSIFRDTDEWKKEFRIVDRTGIMS